MSRDSPARGDIPIDYDIFDGPLASYAAEAAVVEIDGVVYDLNAPESVGQTPEKRVVIDRLAEEASLQWADAARLFEATRRVLEETARATPDPRSLLSRGDE